MTNIQHIELAGQPFVIIPQADYYQMAELKEAAEDMAAFDHIMAQRRIEDEVFPQDFVEQLLHAQQQHQPSIAIWRKYRGLTQQQLATHTGVTQAYISDIESGKKEGSVAILKAIANCLDCDIDDLVGN